MAFKNTHIFLCRSISTRRSSSSFLCFSSRAFLLLSVLPKMSMRSGGEAALSLREEAVLDRERDRDSLRRFLFDSRDLERFLDLSRSLDRDRDRLRFLPCLLLLECLDRDELRLRERPMLTTSGFNQMLNFAAGSRSESKIRRTNTFAKACKQQLIKWKAQTLRYERNNR